MAEPTYDELKTRLAQLEKQGGRTRSGSLDFKVGEKGGVSVYGLGRFPVTLYYEQWMRLLGASEDLKKLAAVQIPQAIIKTSCPNTPLSSPCTTSRRT